MWNVLTKYILRNRILNLVIIGVFTILMGYYALQSKMSYEYAQMLPDNDEVTVVYKDFKQKFEEDGSVFFVGFNDSVVKNMRTYNEWVDVIESVKGIEGVSNVFYIGNSFNLQKDTLAKKFQISNIFNGKVQSQSELDSLMNIAYSLPFYDGMLYDKASNSAMLLIYIDKNVLNTSNRVKLVHDVKAPIEQYEKTHNCEFYYSGMPYIRTITSEMIKGELLFFTILAIVVAIVILSLFFRSAKAVLFSALTVCVGTIWTLGIMSLFGYEITILTGVIPPILIIIGMENCIYFITKYHIEYVALGNQVRALVNVVKKVGYATMLTNITTAIGFASFLITGNNLLVEFGVIASINILLMFVFTLFLIPTLYSFFSVPSKRHLKHLSFKWLSSVSDWLVNIIQSKRKIVLVCVMVLLIVSIYGILKIENKGTMIDDIPHKSEMYTDLMFFEKNYDGVLPIEISINTKKEKGLFSISTINKMDRFQEELKEIHELSKPLSIIEVVKFAKQAFYGGRQEMYSVPNNNEKNFILSYIPNMDKQSMGGNSGILNSFVDTNYSTARISLRIENLTFDEISALKVKLENKLDSIFPTDKYETVVTGSPVVSEKGNKYLARNLVYSLLLAVILISLIMYMLFNSVRMVLVSMVSNLLPLIATAGMMGILHIALKPSTIIIYSVALGIAVDSAIHLLSRYRQQLKINDWNIKESMLKAVKETSSGMIFSGIVLVLGFSVFIFSNFGATQSIGYLVGFTLLVAMFANLIILPSLVLYLDKRVTTKAFQKPVFEGLDEETDENDDVVEI